MEFSGQNTGVGSLSLLQGIFPTQGWNPGLHSEVAQSYPTLCDPMDCSLPGFSVHGIFGFSRQEYWSGLPFPSPGIFPTQGSNPGVLHCRQTLYPLSHQGSPASIREAQEYWSEYPIPSPGDLPSPRIEPRSPQGKLKNTGVGSLSLLQGIFPTQESRGLLHCRRILYQLSHQGSPFGNCGGGGRGGSDKLTQVRCSEVSRILVPSLKGELVNAGTSSQW